MKNGNILNAEILDGYLLEDYADEYILVIPELVILEDEDEVVRKWIEDFLASVRSGIQKIVERKIRQSVFFDHLRDNNPNNVPEDKIELDRNELIQMNDAIIQSYQQLELMLLQRLQPV
jgi:hypothetical protein